MSDPYGTFFDMKYRSTNKCVYLAKYQVIWCPKYRRRVISVRVESGLKVIIKEVVAGAGGQVIGLGAIPGHLHLLVEVQPTVAPSGLVQKLKGRSSRQLRQEFWHLRRLPAPWSPSWLVSTVGGAETEVVRRYVQNQKLSR